jgi:hypothetical protein
MRLNTLSRRRGEAEKNSEGRWQPDHLTLAHPPLLRVSALKFPATTFTPPHA